MFPISDESRIRHTRPFVNITLISICAAVFIYELVIGETGRSIFFYQFGVIPAELTRGISYDIIRTPAGTFNIASPMPDWATVLTSMFIHGDWMHFASNMLFLWVFGDNIEYRLGHFRYLLFYLAAGVAAVALQVLTNMRSELPTIGASGAIAGVLGAYLVFFPFNRIKTVVIFFFINIVRIPALLLLGFWFLLQFVGSIGSLGPSAQTGGIAYWAHVGGFAFGMAVAFFYRLLSHHPPPSRPETTYYWRGRPL